MTMPDWLDVDAFKDALANAGGAGSRTASQLDNETLEQHLGEAWGEVRGVLVAAGFKIPDDAAAIDTIPPLLVGIVQGVAGYTATLEYFGSQPLEDRDPVNLRYARAQSLLGRIAAGKLDMGEPVEPTDPGQFVYDPVAYGGVDVGLAATMLPGYPGDDTWHGMRTGR